MSVKSPHPSIIGLGIAAISAIALIDRLTDFVPGRVDINPYGGWLGEQGALIDRRISQWGATDSMIGLALIAGFAMFVVFVNSSWMNNAVFIRWFLPLPKFPSVWLVTAITTTAVCAVGLINNCEKVHDLGGEASGLLKELDKSVVNSDTVGGVLETALAIVSKDPKSAVSGVLGLSYSLWDHFSHGREMRQQLLKTDAELNDALWWKHLYICFGSITTMLLLVKLLYSSPYGQD